MAVLQAFALVTTGSTGVLDSQKQLKYLLKRGSKYTNCISLKQGLLFSRGKAANRVTKETKETTSPKIQKQAYFSIHKLQM